MCKWRDGACGLVRKEKKRLRWEQERCVEEKRRLWRWGEERCMEAVWEEEEEEG